MSELEVCPKCGDEFSRISMHWLQSNCPRPADYGNFFCEGCQHGFKSDEGLRSHYYQYPDHKPSTWVECPQCGVRYERIASHWSKSSCEFPGFSDRQIEIMTGVLMGDGCVLQSNDRLPWFSVSMVTEEYLEWFDRLFGIFSNGVELHLTAEEAAERNISRGFRPHADPDDYSDLYRCNLKSHPFFWEFRAWYNSGGKVFPEDIELTPSVLRNWYVCDGNYSTGDSHRRIRIGMSNEQDNKDKIVSYFEDVGLSRPSNFDEYERDNDRIDCIAVWDVGGTKELFEYMNHPLPGFEYKWPEEYRKD